MRAQVLSIYRRAVRTKDGRLFPKPVLGDSGSCHCPDATSGPSSPEAHYSDTGLWAIAMLLQAAFGQHHNNRQEIVPTIVSIGKEEKQDYLRNSVDQRRDDGAVN